MWAALSRRWRSSFRFQLILATAVSITAMVAIYSGLLFWHNATVSEAAQKERAARLTSLLAESLALPMYEFNVLAVEAGARALESHAEMHSVRVFDSADKVMVERVSPGASGAVLVKVERLVTHKTGKRSVDVGRIELSFSRGALDAELYRAFFETLIGGLLMAVVTIGAALWASRSATRPLSDITDGLDQLAAGEAEVSLPATGRSDEFGRIINAMHRFRDAIVARRLAEQEVRETEFRHRMELEDTVAQRTAQLAEAKEVAEAANRAKSAFVANMSHEIRTPLNAVLGLAKIIVREDHGRKSGQTAGRILEAGKHLLSIINDVLDFSKIEAGKMVVELQPFELASSMARATDMVQERAALKQLHFTTMLAPDLPAWVNGDQLRIEQILINLLSNAVKFTAQGTVSMNVTREAGLIHFCVSDTGIGMSEAELARLFRPFEQADSSTTRRFGGTGLGLAISQSLAQQMGGEIHVASRAGMGSSFTLSLPLPEVAALVRQPTMAAGAQRLRGVRVLAAEDVEFNRYVLEDLLVSEGATVQFADNGRIAMDLLAEQGVERFDIVVTDIQMPVMDGYEVARYMTTHYPGVPVIGLTAHAMTEERDRCLAAGMVAHVTKPIDADQLIACIRQHCPASPQSHELPAADAQGEARAPLHAASLVDWDALLVRYRGRSAFVEKLIRILIDTHGETPVKLREAVRTGDSETVKFVAHTIKGMAGSLEAHALQTCALVVDRRDGNLDDPRPAMELADALEQLLNMLRQRAAQQDIDAGSADTGPADDLAGVRQTAA